MRSHHATHDKVRPYDCTKCSKKFSRKSGLKKHLKQVHNDFDHDLKQVNAYMNDCVSEILDGNMSLTGSLPANLPNNLGASLGPTPTSTNHGMARISNLASNSILPNQNAISGLNAGSSSFSSTGADSIFINNLLNNFTPMVSNSGASSTATVKQLDLSKLINYNPLSNQTNTNL